MSRYPRIDPAAALVRFLQSDFRSTDHKNWGQLIGVERSTLFRLIEAWHAAGWITKHARPGKPLRLFFNVDVDYLIALSSLADRRQSLALSSQANYRQSQSELSPKKIGDSQDHAESAIANSELATVAIGDSDRGRASVSAIANRKNLTTQESNEIAAVAAAPITAESSSQNPAAARTRAPAPARARNKDSVSVLQFLSAPIYVDERSESTLGKAESTATEPPPRETASLRSARSLRSRALRASERSGDAMPRTPPPPATTLAANDEYEATKGTTLKQPTAAHADGRRVTRVWLESNSSKLSQADVRRLLDVPVYKTFRGAAFAGFARDVAKAYWVARSEATGEAWSGGSETRHAFKAAAAAYAVVFAERGFTIAQYIEAARDVCPKNLRFPPPRNLAGGWAERIMEWVPPDQRTTDEAGAPVARCDWGPFDRPGTPEYRAAMDALFATAGYMEDMPE